MPVNNNIVVFGGSRNIGYYSSLRFLALGSTVTFLLRSPSVFAEDQEIQKYVNSGKAFLVSGDALVEADVRKAWEEASKHGDIDLCLFTVGGTPTFSLTGGAIITPPNLCTQALLNVLCTIPSSSPHVRFITISSTGLTKASHAKLPVLLKPVYGYLLRSPHKDKLGAERALAHCAGLPWNNEEDPEETEMLGADWRNRAGLPKERELEGRVLVIRPAFLTDGKCVADEKGANGYRFGQQEIKSYTVSRRDVAHFVVEAAEKKRDEVFGQVVNVGY